MYKICKTCCNILTNRQKSFCSHKCRNTFGWKTSNTAWNKGKTKFTDSRLKGGRKLGSVPWNKGLKGLKIGPKGQTWKLSEEAKLKMRGRVPWNKKYFNGEIRPVDIIRHSREYKEFRFRMFQRDNFTCRFCGKLGEELNLDHILPTCEYLHLIMDENNVRTLCDSCHKKTETFGMNQYVKRVSRQATLQ